MKTFPHLAVLLLVAAGALRAAERFDWMPPEASADQLRGDDAGGEQILPEIAVTPTPKPTADLTNFTRVFTIDLGNRQVDRDPPWGS